MSKLGAMRLSRKEAIIFLNSQEKVGNYFALMVQTMSGSGETQLGYIMFEIILNKEYAHFVDENVSDLTI
eukprot:6546536-Heterocapsa_arctica.AAC.1